MAIEALAWPSLPALTDAVDGATDFYTMGPLFTVSEVVPCPGIRWRVPDNAPAPTGGFFASLWEVSPNVRIAHQAITPTPGGDQDFLWTEGPIMLDPAKSYICQVFTHHYSVRTEAQGATWPVSTPSGIATATIGKLGTTGPEDMASSNFASYYYVSPLIGEDDGVPSPVTSSLTARWRVFNQVESTLDSSWRVYAKTGVSSLVSSWRVFQRVTGSLISKWMVTGAPVEPPQVSTRYLDIQRSMTAKFIEDDPTTAQLIPRVRVQTAGGGYTYSDGPPRAFQTFKLSLLGFDQRPTLTVAGVERVMDYHLIGPHDMSIAVGDYWEDDEGTRFEVGGFSEGWGYMTKAFVARIVPREARP